MWLEPQKQGEFDVAIGAQVRRVDGNSIILVDDDKNESQAAAGSRCVDATGSGLYDVMWHNELSLLLLYGRH